MLDEDEHDHAIPNPLTYLEEKDKYGWKEQFKPISYQLRSSLLF